MNDFDRNSDSEQYDAPSDTSGPDCDDANEDVEINSESHDSNSTTAQNDELGSSCSSECCRDDLSEPYHPTNILLSKKRQGKQSRTFQRGWFVEYKWLTYCETRHKAFCFTCRLAAARRMIHVTGKNLAFVSKGFDNWKKAKERFREHEHCQIH